MKRYAVVLIACMMLAGCGTSSEAVRPSPFIADAMARTEAVKQQRAEAGQEMQDQESLDENERGSGVAEKIGNTILWPVIPFVLGWIFL